MNKTIYYLLVCATALTSGCSKSVLTPDTPQCSDEDTLSLAKEIIVEQVGGKVAIAELIKFEQNISEAEQTQNGDDLTDGQLKDNITLEMPRPTAFNENIKKYDCEATLSVGKSKGLSVTYESQLADNDQHIVSVTSLSEDETLHLRLALSEKIRQQKPIHKQKTETAPTLQLPFQGEKFFNFMGGNGTSLSISLNSNGETIVKSHGEIESTELYKGKFTNPLTIDQTGTQLLFKDGKVYQQTNGVIDKGCKLEESEPCVSELLDESE